MVLVQKEIKRVTIRPNGVEKQIRPAGWQPGANTLLYLKFENNLDDSSGNSVVMSGNSSYLSYGTIGAKSYIENTGTGTQPVITTTQNLMSQIGAGDFTVSTYVYIPSFSSTRSPIIFGEWYDNSSPRPGIYMTYYYQNSWFRFGLNGNIEKNTGTYSQNAWYHVVYTRINGTCSVYINGQSAITPYTDNTNLASGSGHVFYMMGRNGYNQQTRPVTGVKYSELIYEKRGWTAQEVTDYYNLTKGNYGL